MTATPHMEAISEAVRNAVRQRENATAAAWDEIAARLNSEAGRAAAALSGPSRPKSRRPFVSPLNTIGSPSPSGAVPWGEIAKQLNAEFGQRIGD